MGLDRFHERGGAPRRLFRGVDQGVVDDAAGAENAAVQVRPSHFSIRPLPWPDYNPRRNAPVSAMPAGDGEGDGEGVGAVDDHTGEPGCDDAGQQILRTSHLLQAGPAPAANGPASVWVMAQ